MGPFSRLTGSFNIRLMYDLISSSHGNVKTKSRQVNPNREKIPTVLNKSMNAVTIETKAKSLRSFKSV